MRMIDLSLIWGQLTRKRTCKRPKTALETAHNESTSITHLNVQSLDVHKEHPLRMFRKISKALE